MRIVQGRENTFSSSRVLEDGELALVDVQDARIGPDSYDLASLLHDAYIDIEPAWFDPLVDLYRSLLDAPPPADAFRSRRVRSKLNLRW